MTTIVVIAKEPVPGRVKTRLVPPLDHERAAALAAASLLDTFEALDALPPTDRVLAFDGDATAWAPDGWRVVPQSAGGLDARLAAAFASCPGRPAVLVGMDTPQLRAEHVSAFDPSRFDAALGPATDGGYWAIGFADPARAADAILGVPMSTSETGAHQLDRLRRLGMRVQLLDDLTDVDDITTAEIVAGLAPASRFARALTSCRERA